MYKLGETYLHLQGLAKVPMFGVRNFGHFKHLIQLLLFEARVDLCKNLTVFEERNSNIHSLWNQQGVKKLPWKRLKSIPLVYYITPVIKQNSSTCCMKVMTL